MNSLSVFLAAQKTIYIKSCEVEGGRAQGFRDHISEISKKDPMLFKKWQFEALMEAATRKWQAQPRLHEPDLFTIGGQAIPEFLTRPSKHFDGGEIDDEHEDNFEKVDFDFATVQDLREDALIKMRKAAQSSAAAERQMKTADEARRRAKGKMNVFIKVLGD
jgi:hypothetical protein